MRIREDIAGERFGRLVAIRDAEDDANGKRRIVVRCDCGAECVVQLNNLRNGHTQSCGCLMREFSATNRLTHGARRQGVDKGGYHSWTGMIQRCTNSKSHNYPDYGGRGITICDQWRDYSAFLADMGPRPSPAHTIDRIDNNGPYAHGNCRWATRVEQNRNRGCVRLFDVNDNPIGILAAAKHLAMPESSLRLRLSMAGVL